MDMPMTRNVVVLGLLLAVGWVACSDDDSSSGTGTQVSDCRDSANQCATGFQCVDSGSGWTCDMNGSGGIGGSQGGGGMAGGNGGSGGIMGAAVCELTCTGVGTDVVPDCARCQTTAYGTSCVDAFNPCSLDSGVPPGGGAGGGGGAAGGGGAGGGGGAPSCLSCGDWVSASLAGDAADISETCGYDAGACDVGSSCELLEALIDCTCAACN
jgi:hypothetical protein